MAASNQEALKTLDNMFNEVLVQAGKHLKSAGKDGTRGLPPANNAIRAKTSDALTSYHYALNDLESEITRAKAVLMRDLEKLRSARIPAPAPVPVPQPVAPPAPMMELPSSAAHTMSAPAFVTKREGKTVAPFPDMGMGMSADVVDLTSGEKKPSPRVPASAIKPPMRPSPTVKNEKKPSPKQTPKPAPKPAPKAAPSKITPVPPPQIPRLQPPQPSTVGPAATMHSQPPVPPSQPTKSAQAAQDSSLGSMLSLPATGPGGDAGSTAGSNELNFTDMQFTLAPSNSETQGAPPAPMSEFDLASFTVPGASNETQAHDTLGSGNNDGTAAAATQPPKEENKDNNLDDLFTLGDSNDGTMFDLGSSSVNDSTFDDMMFFDNKDEMGQFDDAYFGLG
ncbi:hypothetical protein F5B20DRAFT_520073 [Whalleya microplaca]|nr:hypothetical protein F5B20DRAFT_520073 [Whalleya microplaca]